LNSILPEEIDKLRRESPNRLCGYLAGESLPQPRSRRAVLLGALLTAVSPLMAQSGRVRIRVTDLTGTVIPGAEASLLGIDEKLILAGRADKAGEIVLTGLPIGDSRITLTCPGFKNLPLVVTIRNADELNVDAKLEVGPVTMGIFLDAPHKTVTAPTPQVEPPSQVSQPKTNRKRWWIFR
jgi:hypothetical protein